jgi:hypothetical protein
VVVFLPQIFLFSAFSGDPIEFLSWLLNSLHITLNGTKGPNSSIIYKAFQGNMKVYTRKILPMDLVIGLASISISINTESEFFFKNDEEKNELLQTQEYQGIRPFER